MHERLIELLQKANKDENLIYYDLSELTDRLSGCAEYMADYLLENGVVVLPCKVGQMVYKIEPLWYETFSVDITAHKCFNCAHFYEGGYGDPAECELGKNCCYHIVEKEANLRRIGGWITPDGFTGEIAWGKTVFLTKEEAEKALERSRQ